MGAPAGHQHAEPAAEATERSAAAAPAPAAPLTARVLQLQGTIGNRAVRHLLRQPTTTAPSAPAPVAAGPGEMTREEFERVMARRFGVYRIRNGSEREMIGRSHRHGVTPPTSLPGWNDWNPGASSSVYQSIVDAFGDIELSFNGVPDVREIVFFDADYEWNGTTFARRDDVGASFGAGHLTVYRSLTTHHKGIPVARSNARGRYPSVVIGLGQAPDEVPGAPRPMPSRAESQRRLIAHELGHGLAEAAHGGTNPANAADSTMMADWRQAVGWTATEPAELFDMGDRGRPAGAAGGDAPDGDADHPPDLELRPVGRAARLLLRRLRRPERGLRRERDDVRARARGAAAALARAATSSSPPAARAGSATSSASRSRATTRCRGTTARATPDRARLS